MELKSCPFCGEIPDFNVVPKTVLYNSFALRTDPKSEITVKAKCPKCNIAFERKITGSIYDGIPVLDLFQTVCDVEDIWNERSNNGDC